MSSFIENIQKFLQHLQDLLHQLWSDFRAKKRSSQQKIILIGLNLLCAFLTMFIFIPAKQKFKIRVDINSILLMKKSMAYITNTNAGSLENVDIHIYAFTQKQNTAELWKVHFDSFEQGQQKIIHQKDLRNIRKLQSQTFLEFARIDIFEDQKRIFHYLVPEQDFSYTTK